MPNSATLKSVTRELATWMGNRKSRGEKSPPELREKVVKLLKSGETDALSLSKKTGVPTLTISRWAEVAPRRPQKSKKKAARKSPKHSSHTPKRAAVAPAKRKKRKSAKTNKTHRGTGHHETNVKLKAGKRGSGISFAELQNAQGDILRIPYNKETLPILVASHYGRKLPEGTRE